MAAAVIQAWWRRDFDDSELGRSVVRGGVVDDILSMGPSADGTETRSVTTSEDDRSDSFEKHFMADSSGWRDEEELNTWEDDECHVGINVGSFAAREARFHRDRSYDF